MAATFVSRIAGIAARFRKPIATTALVLFSNGDPRGDQTASPTISSGTGAPTEAAPNGSFYTRTDATDGDDAIYARVAGSWIPIFGQTA